MVVPVQTRILFPTTISQCLPPMDTSAFFLWASNDGKKGGITCLGGLDYSKVWCSVILCHFEKNLKKSDIGCVNFAFTIYTRNFAKLDLPDSNGFFNQKFILIIRANPYF